MGRIFAAVFAAAALTSAGVSASPQQPASPNMQCAAVSPQETSKVVFAAWADGRLTAQEAAGLNRARHCQLDQNGDGSVSVEEFVAVSLADFDRADRNKDGTLSGKQEIGALAGTGGAAPNGLTRKQAEDLARLRFAVLDRQPRNNALSLEEYLAVTAQEFARSDANGDGALTLQEATRSAQKP